MKSLQWLFAKLSQKHHHLSTLLIALISLWLLGAIILIGLSLNVSWRLEERGIAINEVGSLRKRAFYMVSLANDTQYVKLNKEYNEFTTILNKLKNGSTYRFNNAERYQRFLTQLENTEKNTVFFWYDLQDYAEMRPNNHLPTVSMLEVFTDEISNLVSIIEEENTSSIILLRWLQAILILMAVSSAFLSSIFLKHLVISPLNRLNEGIRLVGKGELETKVNITIKNEFGEVAEGFNQMSVELKLMYGNLEELVNEKTQALHQRNQDLAFLYDVSSALQHHRDMVPLSEFFLEEIVGFANAKAGAVRLINHTKNQTELVASHGLSDRLLEAQQCYFFDSCYCGKALKDPNAVSFFALNDRQFSSVLCRHYDMYHLVSFHIATGEEKLGVMNLFFEKEEDFDTATPHLIETASRQFALALTNTRLEQLDKEMAIVEERNLMAKGLHDSIAQSLSFLNMQAQVLEGAIQSNNEAMRHQALSFIKEGIQECYDDVRELLSNFRISLHKEGFESSINQAIERFKRQMAIEVAFSYQGRGSELQPEEQLQVIFILQEALSNVRKYSEASHVVIEIDHNHHALKLVVKDNGQGFDPVELQSKQAEGHVGTFIMAERAHKVNGMLTIVSNKGYGTTVELVIERKIDTKEENSNV